MVIMLWHFKKYLLVTAALHIAACGSIQENQPEVSPSPSGSSVHQPQLSLVVPSAYNMIVEGCASGYEKALNETNSSNIDLYVGDRSCLAKLLDFTHDGKLYLPEAGNDFATYAEGETAIFISEDGLSRFNVVVRDQLSDPIQVADQISYRFRQIFLSGQTANLLEISLGNVGKATGNQGSTPVDPPDFSLRQANFVDIDAATSRGRFEFYLECNTVLTNSGNTNNVACGTTKLKDLSYLLVADNYSNVPCTTANITPCNNIKNQNTTYTINFATAEYIVPGPILANGGFRTKIGAGVAILGPATMVSEPNMILMLANTRSYQYFNVDLEISSTFLAFADLEDGILP
jgi:hypothetical protein